MQGNERIIVGLDIGTTKICAVVGEMLDDEINITLSFQRLFRKEPYRILTANSGQQALEILETETVEVVVSDQRMPGMTGAELFTIIQQRYPHTIRLLLSGYTDFDALTYATPLGPRPRTPELVRAQAQRMQKDPRAKAKLRDFLHHWLHVEEGSEIAKDQLAVVAGIGCAGEAASAPSSSLAGS